MNFDATSILKLHLGRSWIDVKATLLSDLLLLIPLHSEDSIGIQHLCDVISEFDIH